MIVSSRTRMIHGDILGPPATREEIQRELARFIKKGGTIQRDECPDPRPTLNTVGISKTAHNNLSAWFQGFEGE